MTETTHQVLSNPYTILNDRILWFDGDSSYTVKGLADKLLAGEEDWVNNFVIDPEEFSVKRFNQLDEGSELKAKENLNFTDEAFEWTIPDEYKTLSVENVVFDILKSELINGSFTEMEMQERADRVNLELKLWEERGLINLLRALMYIVDTFVENDIIWGTGRGSSCCSYVLYLIGVHDVDSIYYDLDISDFFRA